MALLIAALGMFVAWHFLLCFRNPEVGWIWAYLLDFLEHPGHYLHYRKFAIGFASFLNFSLLIVVSPFLMQVWLKSRLAWWFAVISSGLAAAGFWGVVPIYGLCGSFNAGCILLAPLLNFAGLVLARGKTPPNPGSPAV